MTHPLIKILQNCLDNCKTGSVCFRGVLQIGNTDIPIDTIGIGNLNGHNYDPEFLRELSRITGGRFTGVDEPLKLTSVIKHLLTYTPDAITQPQEGVIAL